jgi:hypothetical protein
MNITVGVILASLMMLGVAVAQSPAGPPTFDPVPASTAPAAPVPDGKRFACQAAAQGVKGQDRRDQMQLCMAQAHNDCLKQAIEQKIVGPQRKDFLKSCAE